MLHRSSAADLGVDLNECAHELLEVAKLGNLALGLFLSGGSWKRLGYALALIFVGQSRVRAMHGLTGLVAAAVGLAALAQAFGQGAAKKPAVQREASDLGAKVSLGRGKLGAMEVVAHLGLFYTLHIYNIQDTKAESDYKMNANLHLERWRIGKRIESGGYLGNKFTVAESLLRRASNRRRSSVCGREDHLS